MSSVADKRVEKAIWMKVGKNRLEGKVIEGKGVMDSTNGNKSGFVKYKDFFKS